MVNFVILASTVSVISILWAEEFRSCLNDRIFDAKRDLSQSRRLASMVKNLRLTKMDRDFAIMHINFLCGADLINQTFIDSL